MSAGGQYEFLIALLFVTFVLTLGARRLGLPPAAAFIAGGIALALLPGVPQLVLDPDLVLLVFLPPLLMNSAYFTVWRDFRENLGGIAFLAIGAVVFTTVAVGLVAKALAPSIPWAVCFALGAIVSPPDAVAAEAVLERVTLPGRVNALLSGESLLNDATGLVLLRFAVAAAATGSFSLAHATATFVVVAAGGVGIGYGVGRLGVVVFRRLQSSELAITASLLLTLTSYVSADRMGLSGVLATVTTGLILGWRQHEVMQASTRMEAQAFWKVLVFLLQSLLFILIGLSLRPILAHIGEAPHLMTHLVLPVLGVTATVIASRFVGIGLSDLAVLVLRRTCMARLPRPSLVVSTVMGWAGMRGVVTLAAALSLPTSMPGRDVVLCSAFAVIVVTVLVQGTTLGPLIRWLRVTAPGEIETRETDAHEAWARLTAAQLHAIKALPDSALRHPRLLEQYGLRAKLARDYIADQATHRETKADHHRTVIVAIAAGRAEAVRMLHAGEIHDRAFRALENELDLQQLVAESHLD